MAVDIFEAVRQPARSRHEFNNAGARMARQARRLVKTFPAAEVRFDPVGEFAQHSLEADMMDKPHHVLDADEGHQRLGGWEQRVHRKLLKILFDGNVSALWTERNVQTVR